ncbi:unnamed protein product [Acanthoscelides obtectus]|uniref:Uncharacterized protein n=1 Tax=Acanthoscelides obtectus TaxID=200917 RepID=A0A9P0P8V4_ACAOB|nr:unnamed protein product [Acanthoscelides obtectus]CAK1685434.1 hypothetical protein AOBTE_LOCUS35395 [Acanthoscelides obtectus]
MLFLLFSGRVRCSTGLCQFSRKPDCGWAPGSPDGARTRTAARRRADGFIIRRARRLFASFTFRDNCGVARFLALQAVSCPQTACLASAQDIREYISLRKPQRHSTGFLITEQRSCVITKGKSKSSKKLGATGTTAAQPCKLYSLLRVKFQQRKY